MPRDKSEQQNPLEVLPERTVAVADVIESNSARLAAFNRAADSAKNPAQTPPVEHQPASNEGQPKQEQLVIEAGESKCIFTSGQSRNGRVATELLLERDKKVNTKALKEQRLQRADHHPVGS